MNWPRQSISVMLNQPGLEFFAVANLPVRFPLLSHPISFLKREDYSWCIREPCAKHWQRYFPLPTSGILPFPHLIMLVLIYLLLASKKLKRGVVSLAMKEQGCSRAPSSPVIPFQQCWGNPNTGFQTRLEQTDYAEGKRRGRVQRGKEKQLFGN